MDIDLTEQQKSAIVAITKWFKSDDRKQIFLLAGSAGCIDEETKILTDVGTIRLSDFLLSSRNNLDFEGFEDYKGNIKIHNGTDFVDVSKIYATDIINGYKIKLRSGLELKCSHIHPLKTINENGKYEWVKSQDLKLNDYVATIGNKSIHDIDKLELLDDYYYMGYYIADGCKYRKRYSFTSQHEDKLINLKTYLSDKDEVVSKSKIKEYLNRKKDKYLYVYGFISNWFDDLIESIGFDVKQKKIDLSKLDTPSKKYSLLRGMMNDISIGKQNIEFSNLHRHNIDIFMVLMREFGIVWYMKGNRTKNNIYSCIINRHSVKQLYKVFGELEGSKSHIRLSEFIQNSKKSNTNINIIPNMNIHFNKHRSKIINTRTSSDYRIGRRKPSYDKLKIFNTEINYPEIVNKDLNDIVNDNYYWDKIVDIQPITQKFYDVTIPSNHTFISNSIISHNTGKTSLINYAVDELGIHGKVLYMAYTGKATTILHKKGIEAHTIHSKIYQREESYDDKKDELNIDYYLKGSLSDTTEYKLLVIDEISMVDKLILEDLKSFNIPMLCIGDGAQLPPVQSKFNIFETSADYTLTEIHRQAMDNPIIRLATDVRNGLPIKYGMYGNKVSVRKSLDRDLELNIMGKVDQILTSLNWKRREVNNLYRKHFLGLDDNQQIVKDEKIICRKNNKKRSIKIDSTNHSFLANGTIGTVDYVKNCKGIYTRDVNVYNRATKEKFPINTFQFNFKCYLSSLKMNSSIEAFYDDDKDVTKKVMSYSNIDFFQFAYAISVHLSQGSEWDSGLVYAGFFFDHETTKKLLYTAITRFKEKLILIY